MISQELTKLLETEWKKFVDRQAKVHRYHYSIFEKDLFIVGFREGFMIGRTMSNPELKSKTKKELRKKL